MNTCKVGFHRVNLVTLPFYVTGAILRARSLTLEGDPIMIPGMQQPEALLTNWSELLLLYMTPAQQAFFAEGHRELVKRMSDHTLWGMTNPFLAMERYAAITKKTLEAQQILRELAGMVASLEEEVRVHRNTLPF